MARFDLGRKRNNLRFSAPVAVLHTLSSVMEAGVKGVQAKRPNGLGGWIGDVNQAVPASELDRQFANNGRSTKRHNAYPRPKAIRRVSERAILTCVNIVNALISHMNLRGFAPDLAHGAGDGQHASAPTHSVVET